MFSYLHKLHFPISNKGPKSDINAYQPRWGTSLSIGLNEPLYSQIPFSYCMIYCGSFESTCPEQTTMFMHTARQRTTELLQCVRILPEIDVTSKQTKQLSLKIFIRNFVVDIWWEDFRCILSKKDTYLCTFPWLPAIFFNTIGRLTILCVQLFLTVALQRGCTMIFFISGRRIRD